MSKGCVKSATVRCPPAEVDETQQATTECPNDLPSSSADFTTVKHCSPGSSDNLSPEANYEKPRTSPINTASGLKAQLLSFVANTWNMPALVGIEPKLTRDLWKKGGSIDVSHHGRVNDLLSASDRILFSGDRDAAIRWLREDSASRAARLTSRLELTKLLASSVAVDLATRTRVKPRRMLLLPLPGMPLQVFSLAPVRPIQDLCKYSARRQMVLHALSLRVSGGLLAPTFMVLSFRCLDENSLM